MLSGEQLHPSAHESGRAQSIVTQGWRGGPINGVLTGLVKPKNITAPLPPNRVDSAGGGTFLKPTCSGISQLFATHTLPGGGSAVGCEGSPCQNLALRRH